MTQIALATPAAASLSADPAAEFRRLRSEARPLIEEYRRLRYDEHNLSAAFVVHGRAMDVLDRAAGIADTLAPLGRFAIVDAATARNFLLLGDFMQL